MPKSLWLIVIGLFVIMTGSSFLWPLNAIYIHDHLGKSLTVAGIVLTLNSAASVIGNLVGGTLYDKIGGYRAILLGGIITVTAMTGLTFWPGWPHYVIFLIFIGFGGGLVFPSMYAMAGSVWKEGGRKVFNAMYVAHNAGVAVGSALGGFIASLSFEYIFKANLFTYIIFLVIAVFGYRRISGQQVKQMKLLQERKRIGIQPKFRALLILCGSYLLCWVCYVQWFSTISTHTQEIGISLKQYSLLWTVNGALIVLAQPLMALALRRFKNNLKTQILVGMSIFIVSYGVAGTANEFKGFLAAIIILTVGEMLVWPVIPTIANDLAPKGREGFYQGIVNSTATGGRMIGPLLGGLLVDLYGILILFGVLIFLLVLGLVLTYLYDRPIKASEKEDAIAAS